MIFIFALIPTVWLLGQLWVLSVTQEVLVLTVIDFLFKLALVLVFIGSVSYRKQLEEAAEVALIEASRLRAEACVHAAAAVPCPDPGLELHMPLSSHNPLRPWPARSAPLRPSYAGATRPSGSSFAGSLTRAACRCRRGC